MWQHEALFTGWVLSQDSSSFSRKLRMIWMKPFPGETQVLRDPLGSEINLRWFCLFAACWNKMPHHSALLLGFEATLIYMYCTMQILQPVIIRTRWANARSAITIPRSIAKLSPALNLLCVCVSSCALDSYGSYPGKVTVSTLTSLTYSVVIQITNLSLISSI